MTDNGFGQDEYGQPNNSMGFVTDDKHAEEKQKKWAEHDKKVMELIYGHRDSYLEDRV